MNTQKSVEVPGKLIEKPMEDDVLLKLPAWKIWYSMSILYLLYFFDYAARLVISPLFPYLKKDLGLTDPQLGMLTSVVLAGVCILSMPLAAFIDRWKRSKTLSLVAVIWSVASVGTGLSQTFAQIFASRAAVGIGEAGFSSGGAALISAMFSRTKRAMMIGIWNTSMTAGAAFGLMVGGIIAVKYGWQTAFYAVGIPGVILGVMAWFMPDYENIPREKDAAALSFFGAFKGVLTNKSLVWMYFACGLGAVLLQTQLYWTSSLFVRFMGMTPAEAGTINGYMMFVGFISYPLSGWLADRWSEKDLRGRMYFCAIMQLIACVACAAGVMLLNIPLLALAMFFTFCIPSAQVAFTQEIVPLFNRATAYGGYVLTLYVLGGLWGPMLTGFVSAASNLQMGFLAAAGVSLVSVLCYLAGSRYVIVDFNNARAKEKEMGC
ncbi:MFS transporter [Anaerospora hongkongensis]|uniref:MFS transporter n=1 Tax=Anaerospora hongkongensis TaxID=244830 RepID=UPI002FDAA1E0